MIFHSIKIFILTAVLLFPSLGETVFAASSKNKENMKKYRAASGLVTKLSDKEITISVIDKKNKKKEMRFNRHPMAKITVPGKNQRKNSRLNLGDMVHILYKSKKEEGNVARAISILPTPVSPLSISKEKNIE